MAGDACTAASRVSLHLHPRACPVPSRARRRPALRGRARPRGRLSRALLRGAAGARPGAAWGSRGGCVDHAGAVGGLPSGPAPSWRSLPDAPQCPLLLLPGPPQALYDAHKDEYAPSRLRDMRFVE